MLQYILSVQLSVHKVPARCLKQDHTHQDHRLGPVSYLGANGIVSTAIFSYRREKRQRPNEGKEMSGGGECRADRGWESGGWKTGCCLTKGCRSSARAAKWLQFGPRHDSCIDGLLKEESRVFKRATESSQ